MNLRWPQVDDLKGSRGFVLLSLALLLGGMWGDAQRLRRVVEANAKHEKAMAAQAGAALGRSDRALEGCHAEVEAMRERANGAVVDLNACRVQLHDADATARALRAGLEPGRCGILDCAEIERMLKGLQACLQTTKRLGTTLGGHP